MYSRSSVWPFYNPGLPPSHTEKTHVLHFYFVLDPEPVSSPPFCCTASRIAEFISYVRLLQKWNFRHGKGYPLFRFLVAGSCYPTPGFWLLAPSSHSPEIPGMPLTHSQKAQNRLNYCYKLPLPSGNSNNRRQKVEGSRRRAKGQRANRLSFWPRFALSAS